MLIYYSVSSSGPRKLGTLAELAMVRRFVAFLESVTNRGGGVLCLPDPFRPLSANS